MALTSELLSGSTNGTPILVVATATVGTLIHTAHATSHDEVWLWAVNTSGADLKLTIELGGVASPKDIIEMTIPFEDGPYLIVPGIRLTGSVVIGAFAGTTNLITIIGNVNRFTP